VRKPTTGKAQTDPLKKEEALKEKASSYITVQSSTLRRK
jgi:hypothetical protein